MVVVGEQVVLLSRALSPSPDVYGNDVYVETETTVSGCAVWPDSSSEQTDGRDMTIQGLSVLFPPGAPAVSATDRIRARGVVWDVVGVPGVWSSPMTGAQAGTQVSCRRVAG